MQYSTTVNNARLDAVETTIGASPTLTLYSGSATGNVVSGVTATADLLETGDSLTASGAIDVATSGALSESGDTLVASGTVTSGAVDVETSITLVESDDTLQSTATVASFPVGTSEYPFFSAGFFAAGFFSEGFWGDLIPTTDFEATEPEFLFIYKHNYLSEDLPANLPVYKVGNKLFRLLSGTISTCYKPQLVIRNQTNLRPHYIQYKYDVNSAQPYNIDTCNYIVQTINPSDLRAKSQKSLLIGSSKTFRVR